MKLAAAVLGCSLALCSAPAWAQWVYEGGTGAFDGASLNIALVQNLSYGLGVRCRLTNIEMLYLTPDESAKDEDVEALNNINPILRVRVDDAPVVDLPTHFENRSTGLVAVSKSNVDLLIAIRDAKQRIATALYVAGQHHHESTFTVRGSTDAFRKLLADCKIRT